MEELLDWPATRFERMFEAFMQRKAVEKLEQNKLAILGGIWANSNYDGKDSPRKKLMQDVEDSFAIAVRRIYGEEVNEGDDFDFKSDPFFAAGQKALPPEPGRIAQPNIRDYEELDLSDLDQS